MDLNRFKKPNKILILPPNWDEIDAPAYTQRAYMSVTDLRVLVGLEKHMDDNWWKHVSCSRYDCIPTWDDLLEVKQVFIGREKKAIQVFPPESEYVNRNPFVLHLWTIHHFDLYLPDFRAIFDMEGI